MSIFSIGLPEMPRDLQFNNIQWVNGYYDYILAQQLASERLSGNVLSHELVTPHVLEALHLINNKKEQMNEKLLLLIEE